MKVMQALFLLHAVASAIVTLRTQVLLHHFADVAVFHLDLVTELVRRFRRVALQSRFFEEP